MKNRYINFNDLIRNINVDKDLDFRTLYDEAMKYINKHNSIELNQDLVYRAIVNRLRHSHTEYNKGLKSIYKMHNTDIYYNMYKNYVLYNIETEYPAVKEECDRQKHKILMAKCI